MTRHAWYRRRLFGPLGNLLAGGLAPVSLARALTIGMLLGCMPLLWGTSLLCLGAALLLRLNPVAVQIGNFAAWPLQLLLAYPYLWLGSVWLEPVPFPPGPTSPSGMTSLVMANCAALAAWILTSPLLFPVCYAASRQLLAVTTDRIRNQPNTPPSDLVATKKLQE